MNKLWKNFTELYIKKKKLKKYFWFYVYMNIMFLFKILLFFFKFFNFYFNNFVNN